MAVSTQQIRSISQFFTTLSPDKIGTRPPLPGPVLYFAPKECWPPSTGAQLRNFYLSRELALSAHVTYLGFADGVKELSDTDVSEPESRDFGRIITVPRDAGYTPAKILRGAFSSTPLPVLNYMSETMSGILGQVLAERDFTIVQVEGLHLVPYLPLIRRAASRPLVVCDWHNVESELMWRYSQMQTNKARQLYANMTARRMEKLERDIVRQFDAHLVCTERDRQHLLEIEPDAKVYVIENGVNVEYFSRKKAYFDNAADDNPPRRVVFSGSMDYHANIDAVTWFAQEVWPLVWQQRQDLTFTIVGRNPAPAVQALAATPGIEVTGRVQDVRPYYREAVIAAVPLRIGGGSRLKILECMAAGLPVISTHLGAEGLEVESGHNAMLVDDAAEFAHGLLALVNDEALRDRLVGNARELMLARYDWGAIGTLLLNIYLRLLNGER